MRSSPGQLSGSARLLSDVAAPPGDHVRRPEARTNSPVGLAPCAELSSHWLLCLQPWGDLCVWLFAPCHARSADLPALLSELATKQGQCTPRPCHPSPARHPSFLSGAGSGEGLSLGLGYFASLALSTGFYSAGSHPQGLSSEVHTSGCPRPVQRGCPTH